MVHPSSLDLCVLLDIRVYLYVVIKQDYFIDNQPFLNFSPTRPAFIFTELTSFGGAPASL